MIRMFEKTITTDTSGAATDYLGDDVGSRSGRILAIVYTKDDYAAGVDFTITTEDTGQGVWTESDVNASKTVYPSVIIHDQVGNATTQRDFIPFAGERIKVVIAQGGTSKDGNFVLIWDDGKY